jgi:signal transduction histidine kinase
MFSSSGRPPNPVDNTPYRIWTLIASFAGAAIGVVVELLALGDPVAGSAERVAAYFLVFAATGYQLLRERRTEVPLAIVAVVFGALSLSGNAMMTGLDSGTTLAVLILVAVVFVTTREDRTVGPLVVCSGLIAAYTIALVIMEGGPINHATGKLLVGIPGQMLVIWITWRIIQSLGDASTLEARQGRIQEALATCSHALLASREEEPLAEALEALLRATEADYAYVDVNRTDDHGVITWEIVSDAYGDDIPPGPDAFDDGDYSQYPAIAEILSSGKPTRVRVADLPMPLRARYEAEGVRSELMAPIMIRGHWFGTIGFIDFWRDNEWTDLEELALTRAADMVAAYWEREQAREGLEELAKAKDRFIATVSHELRTPLSAVVGFAETLADNLAAFDTAEIGEMVALISTQGREVAQLVEDLLTAERAASGNLTIKSASIDLYEEARAVIESLRLEIEVETDGVQAPRAWADTLRTRQIVRNLLTNAIRYGGDRIKVEAGHRDDRVTLTVVDSGAGVRGIDADHIFDPYFRTQSPDSRPDSVGLGLAVARQLARMMGGDVVYRRRNGWTCFELTLPSADSVVPEVAVAVTG